MRNTQLGRGVRRSTSQFATAGLGLTLAACGGGGGDQSADAGDDAVDQLRVGLLPISTALAFYVADDKGYFEDVNIEVTTTTLQGGPDLFQALEGESLDVIYSGYTSFFVGVSQGYDFRIVAPNDRENSVEQSDGSYAEGINGILVPSDSGIETAADLAGKKVAVNALNSFVQLYTMNWLDAEGGDSEAVEYVPVPYPGMGDALRQGSVDAVNLSEPFLSIELAKGGVEEIGTPLSSADPELVVGGWSARADHVEADPDLFARFSEALKRGAVDANGMSGEEKAQVLAEHLDQDPAAYANARWWHYETDALDIDALQAEADRTLEYGLMENEVDVAQYVAESATDR
jgi:NitT/TauT family transport system substrate-binding protein